MNSQRGSGDLHSQDQEAQHQVDLLKQALERALHWQLVNPDSMTEADIERFNADAEFIRSVHPVRKEKPRKRSFGGIQFTYQGESWGSEDGIKLVCRGSWYSGLDNSWAVEQNPRTGKLSFGDCPENALVKAGILPPSAVIL